MLKYAKQMEENGAEVVVTSMDGITQVGYDIDLMSQNFLYK